LPCLPVALLCDVLAFRPQAKHPLIDDDMKKMAKGGFTEGVAVARSFS
jgi:hypothetical protein